jgi:hypothetical protein
MQGRRVARPIDVSLRADFLVQTEALMVQAHRILRIRSDREWRYPVCLRLVRY